MNFDLRHLEGFVAVAEELHFGRAAERLRVAQPALSQQIQRLEGALGVDLLVRERRRTKLSEAGEAFLIEARRTLAQAEMARTVARRAAAGETGRLRVGYVPTTSAAHFLAALAGFRRAHPDVRLDLHELPLGALAAPLRDDLVDLAFVAQLGALDCLGADISQQIVSTEPFVVAVPAGHPLTAQPEIELARLADEEFVLLAPDICTQWYETVTQTCALAGFAPREIHCREASTQLLMVAAGLGVALVPASAGDLHGAAVRFLSLTGQPQQITSTILWRSTDKSAALARFLQVTSPAAARG